MPAPRNPAPVSGPGAQSQRTDGGPAQALASLPDAKYGENKTYQDLQRQAPLAGSPTPPSATSEGAAPSMWADGGAARQAVIPFSAPTQRPNEPVTSGAAAGPGPGTAALGIQPQQMEQQDMGRKAVYMPFLEAVSNLPSSSPASRVIVNLLKAAS